VVVGEAQEKKKSGNEAPLLEGGERGPSAHVLCLGELRRYTYADFAEGILEMQNRR
jgi:hypothetical protein